MSQTSKIFKSKQPWIYIKLEIFVNIWEKQNNQQHRRLELLQYRVGVLTIIPHFISQIVAEYMIKLLDFSKVSAMFFQKALSMNETFFF